MFRRLAIIVVSLLLGIVGLTTPAKATSYDFAVTGNATANTTTVPSVITWTITVDSVGDLMGSSAAQEGTVEFTAPSTISLVLSDDCDTTGNSVSCAWLVTDDTTQTFEIHGLVALTAVGTISVTPTFTSNTPRTDSNSANDSITLSCTAITSALVTC